jgi:hypothetical protein
MPELETSLKEMMWRKLEKDIDLYKFYLDIAIKTAVFAFGITGALVSYYFSSRQPLVGYALLFPAVMNGGFSVLFHASIDASRKLKESHERTCGELGLPPFDMRPLPSVCVIFASMYLLAAIGLLIIFGLYLLHDVLHVV